VKDGVTRVTYRGAHRYACGIHKVKGFPGATTYMGAMAAPGLEWWKTDQLLRMVMERHAAIPDMLAGDGLDATLSYFHKAGRSAGADKRDTGSEAHAAVEAIVKGQEPVITPRIEGHVEQFRKWMADRKPVIKQSEFMVISERERYGATGDLAFVLDGEYWGVDVKTGKLLPETGMQLAAIRWADHAGRPGDPVEYPVPQTSRHGVLLLHADDVELVPFDIKPDREWKAFLACRDLYEYDKAKSQVLEA